MTAAELAMKVFDEHHLDREVSPQREVSDDWIEDFANTLLKSTPEDAAHAVGAALAEGIAPMTIAEAVAVAANQLVLRDPGRPSEWA